MNENIRLRTQQEAEMIIQSKKTLRDLAKELKIGKSTIHKDMQIRLKLIDKNLYEKVQEVFQEHIRLRHLRGGNSTKKKYQKNKIN